MSAARRFNRRRKTVSARLARAIAAAAYSVRGNPALALPLVIVLGAVATLMACARPGSPEIGDARAAMIAVIGCSKIEARLDSVSLVPGNAVRCPALTENGAKDLAVDPLTFH